jgi:O-antigen/teichoic acid export membrane protein
LASLKKLAGQTAWYGISSIFARLLNYLLTPYLTYYMSTVSYGEMGMLYSAIPFLNVVFTYGMETAFFRFSNKDVNEKHVFNIGSLSLLFTTLLFSALIIIWRQPVAALLRVDNHPEFVTWSALIIALDTLTTLPYAKLRNEGRPRKYAFVRVSGILLNIGLVVFFYSVLPGIAKDYPGSLVAGWYKPDMGAGYVLIANLAMSALALLLLLPEFLSVRFEWDKVLWRQMLLYALPIMVVGFGGVVNETFDRVMLGWWATGDINYQKTQVGIYNGCYKLSILISLFIQAFRLGAEPFFFRESKGENAPLTYARVMNYFVIIICTMFLFVMLYIDVWKHFITNPKMWEGLKVVPILLVANMCLGVYYNLSIWYKLSNNTTAGATITLIGAAVTLVINYLFIPSFGYMACAVATLVCYSGMMLISYVWGQKVYPVPYNLRKVLYFFVVMLFFYFIQAGIMHYTGNFFMHLLTGTILMISYVGFIFKTEGKELKGLPIVGRFVR